MVLVVWSVFFGITSLIGLTAVGEASFSTLVSLLTIIGILAGIFQFYIQSYKEQITQKILNSLSKHMIEITKKLAFNEFIIYLKNGKDKSFYGDIIKKTDETGTKALLKVLKETRSGRDVTNMTFNFLANDTINMARSVEYADGINKDKLKLKYTEFFDAKNKEIKEELDKIDINDIRAVLLPNILFFDEVMTELIKSSYEVEEIETPETYEDYLTMSVQENVLYVINKILGWKVTPINNGTTKIN